MKITYIDAIQKSGSDKSGLLSENPLFMLPLGDICCPDGWLGEQLKLVAGGITGHLPEYSPYFLPENNGFLYAGSPKGWEEVPYWLRGYYPLAVLLSDESMLKTAHDYIEAIFRSVQSDGWFGPAYLKDAHTNEKGAFVPDLFPNMLLTDTLILYYTHTKDSRVLSLLRGYVRFCLSVSDDCFLPPREKGNLRWQKIRAGDMLSQLYWYYRETHDDEALRLSTRVFNSIAKSISGFAATHAVDFSQRFAYDAIYSQQSGKKEHFERSEYEYRHFADVFGQMPRGIFAADEQIREGATDPREAFEPCRIVELAKNFYTLERISGDVKYADRAEDIMLNHFAASFTPDYKQVHYLTGANSPILSNYTQASTFNGSKSHDRSYQIMTPNNRCCGHNTGMGWPWYTMNLWQGTADKGVAAVLYAPCTVHTAVDGKTICLSVKTDYPFRDKIEITVECGGAFPLYLRIPAWCGNAVLHINGLPAYTDARPGGWIRMENEWKTGDKITLCLPMEISLTKWKGNGSVSVDRGPFTYSVRIKEEYRVLEDALAYNHPTPHLWENYEVLPLSAWNFGLVTAEKTEDFISVKKADDTLAKQPFSEENAPIVLSAKAKKIPAWQLQDSCAAELQPSPVFSNEPEERIEMIPMGCARLRMTCLPVISENPSANRWKNTPSHIPCEERPQPFLLDYDFGHKPEEAKQSAPWKPASEK